MESTRPAFESLGPYLWHSSRKFSRDFSSRGDPASDIKKSGLEPACATNRPAELVVHKETSRLHQMTQHSYLVTLPKHACPCHCPATAEACPCCVPTAPALPLPSHRECPPTRNRGLKRSVACYHTCLSPHDPMHDAQGELLSLPLGIASHTYILQCCNTHSAGC